MNADCAALFALEKALSSGEMLPEEVEQRLAAAIEAEYMKDQPRMAFINACEDLLREIRTGGAIPFVSRANEDKAFVQAHTQLRRRGSWSVWVKAGAVAMAFVLVAVFGQWYGQFSWFTGESTDDGEHYLLTGHEVNLEFIQDAIADHHAEARFSSESLEEVIGYLGFVPPLPDMSGLDVQTTKYYVTISEGVVFLDVLYRRDPADLNVVYSVSWYTEEEAAYLSVEQSGDGVTERIAGTDVYCYMNVSRPGFLWTEGLTVYQVSGGWTWEEGHAIVRCMLENRP